MLLQDAMSRHADETGGVRLRQNLLHHSSVNVGEAKIPSSVAVGELFVVEAEQMQEGRVQIMNVNWIFDCFESEFVRSAVNRAAFDAATGHPDTEAVRIVVAPHFRFARVI